MQLNEKKRPQAIQYTVSCCHYAAKVNSWQTLAMSISDCRRNKRKTKGFC